MENELPVPEKNCPCCNRRWTLGNIPSYKNPGELGAHFVSLKRVYEWPELGMGVHCVCKSDFIILTEV